MRFRNLTCYVSDAVSQGEGSLVDEELCSGLELAVNGDTEITLKEACTLPCPGDCNVVLLYNTKNKSKEYTFIYCLGI